MFLKLSINFAGEMLTRAEKSLKAALCVGFMSEAPSVNLINSFEIASNDGITVSNLWVVSLLGD